VVFSAEVLARAWVAPVAAAHAANVLTWVDVAAVVPFFTELGYAGGYPYVDFAVLPSCPMPVFLALAKALKVRENV